MGERQDISDYRECANGLTASWPNSPSKRLRPRELRSNWLFPAASSIAARFLNGKYEWRDRRCCPPRVRMTDSAGCLTAIGHRHIFQLIKAQAACAFTPARLLAHPTPG